MFDPDNEQQASCLRILTRGLDSEADWLLATQLIDDGYVAGSYRRNNLGASKPLAQVTLGSVSSKGLALVEQLKRQERKARQQRLVMRCVITLVAVFVGISLGIGLNRSNASITETLTVMNSPLSSSHSAAKPQPADRPF